MADSIRIDTSDVQREVAFFNTVYPLVRKRIWADIRKATIKIIQQVKSPPPIGMPLDTRRARNDWGSQAEFNEEDLETVHGSRLDYVPLLNEGHSQQAPAGFIDTIVLREGILLADKLGADIEVEFRE